MTPDECTLKEKMLDVGDGHQLYTQLWGNSEAAETIVFLHGGPGSGCSDKHKTLFNPRTDRVIFFDQRGSGKSLPYGSRQNNNTDALVEDINKVTAEYGADSFALTGGSWGSCLALVYAIRYPQKVTRMVLRGLFTARQSEIEFLDNGGFRSFFPDVWQAYLNTVPDKHKNNPGAYHGPRILGDDLEAAKKSAYAYANLESSLISLDDRTHSGVYEEFDPVPAIVEYYYLANDCFLPEGYVFDNAAKLTMPIKLIQGRYDAVCPPFTAYELAQKLPNAQLFWTVAGHSGNDRANWDLTRALLAQKTK